MNELGFLLATYGLMFGVANKVPALHGRSALLDRLLSCSYCLGFHAGWVIGLLSGYIWFGLLICGFKGAAFCYTLDTFVQYLEVRIGYLNIRGAKGVLTED